MSTLAERRRARKEYERIRKTKPLGEGSRFKALARIAELGGAKNPEAVAAKIMWRKYGKKKGIELIKKGKREAKKSK